MRKFKLLFTFLAIFIFSNSFGQLHIAQGKTSSYDWKTYVATNARTNPENGKKYGGIYVDVNTSSFNFKETPQYIVTIEGTKGGQWGLSGASAVYDATPTGFSVYLRWTDSSGYPGDENPITKETARKYNWYIRWTAISTSD